MHDQERRAVELEFPVQPGQERFWLEHLGRTAVAIGEWKQQLSQSRVDDDRRQRKFVVRAQDEVRGADRRRDHLVEPVGFVDVGESDLVGGIDRAIAFFAQDVGQRRIRGNCVTRRQVVPGASCRRTAARQDGDPGTEGSSHRCGGVLDDVGLLDEPIDVRRVARRAAEPLQLVQPQGIDAEQDDVRSPAIGMRVSSEGNAFGQKSSGDQRGDRSTSGEPAPSRARMHAAQGDKTTCTQNRTGGDYDRPVHQLPDMEWADLDDHPVVVMGAEKGPWVPECVVRERRCAEQREPADGDATELVPYGRPERNACIGEQPRERAHANVQDDLREAKIGHLAADLWGPDVAGDGFHHVGRLDAVHQGDHRRIGRRCQEQKGKHGGDKESASERQVPHVGLRGEAPFDHRHVCVVSRVSSPLF